MSIKYTTVKEHKRSQFSSQDELSLYKELRKLGGIKHRDPNSLSKWTFSGKKYEKIKKVLKKLNYFKDKDTSTRKVPSHMWGNWISPSKKIYVNFEASFQPKYLWVETIPAYYWDNDDLEDKENDTELKKLHDVLGKLGWEEDMGGQWTNENEEKALDKLDKALRRLGWSAEMGGYWNSPSEKYTCGVENGVLTIQKR